VPADRPESAGPSVRQWVRQWGGRSGKSFFQVARTPFPEAILSLPRSAAGGNGRLTDHPFLFTIHLMYAVEYTEGVAADLKTLRPLDRRRILDKIDEQLLHSPTRPTRNKKIVVGLKPPWQHEEPVWELRVGRFRVFYDVDETEQRVMIRAVREKPPHRTTEEIL
jgi:mRNA-degrading endonuclease RelE of RelBE toxin-antitoxin system